MRKVSFVFMTYIHSDTGVTSNFRLQPSVIPAKAGIQASSLPFVLSVAKRSRRTGCRITSGMTRAPRNG